MRKTVLTEEEQGFIFKNSKLYMASQLAEMFGTTNNVIYWFVNKNKLELRKKPVRVINKETMKKYLKAKKVAKELDGSFYNSNINPISGF